MAKMSRMNCVTMTMLIISMIVGYMAAEYMSTDDNQDDLDYYGIMLANLINNRQLLSPDKRSCLRRGSPCDHRPNDCCPQSNKYYINKKVKRFK
ncbi:hypothetical protein DERF_000262 [Dermatophagoides farinae]|uniref:Uncharacterized protein n=1 Tax=Dermatophagoides farinae TaxID=6954 RepID=A0A922I700_DERFA|nr:hypothetical protein DERF_000262 [Dermatophagoides farinae]